MARKLSDKQRAFTLRVFEAKEEPGPIYLSIYAVKSMAVASAAGSRLLTNVKVQEYLKELRQKTEDESVATVLERKQVATQIVRGRFADFMTNLTPEKLRSPALKRIKVTEGPTGGKTTTIELHSPLEGVDRLNTLDQIYKDGPAVVVDARSVNIGEGAGEDAKDKLIAEVARVAARIRAGKDNQGPEGRESG